MKMIVSIVNRDDARGLTDALMREGYRATTISTTGGFLRQGNATLLIGTEDEQVDDVLEIVRSHCHTRTERVTPLPPFMGVEEYIPLPVEVQIGGAVVFVLSVDRTERY
jgi:uncharacterized protein YaaQ